METLATIKQVSMKVLMSGDKEVRIVLSVVGAEVDNAIDFSKLDPGTLVLLKKQGAGE